MAFSISTIISILKGFYKTYQDGKKYQKEHGQTPDNSIPDIGLSKDKKPGA